MSSKVKTFKVGQIIDGYKILELDSKARIKKAISLKNGNVFVVGEPIIYDQNELIKLDNRSNWEKEPFINTYICTLIDLDYEGDGDPQLGYKKISKKNTPYGEVDYEDIEYMKPVKQAEKIKISIKLPKKDG